MSKYREMPCQEIPGKYHLQRKCQTSNFFKINQILLDLKILLHVESQKAHNFELHQGKVDFPHNIKRLGLGNSIVMGLSNIISRKQNFKLFFDNYFSSMRPIRLLKMEH